MTNPIFLCYAKPDREFVARVEAGLASNGFETWVEYRDMKAAKVRRDVLYEKAKESDITVVFLSENSLDDELLRQQIFIASCYHKRIIPVVIDNCWKRLDEHDETNQLKELWSVSFDREMETDPKLGFETALALLFEAINPKPEPVPLNDELIYICHAWEDRLFAERVARDLKKARGNVYLGTISTVGGDNWRTTMINAMMEASILIVCLSPEAAKSSWVRREVLLAHYIRKIPIIPVVTERVYHNTELFETLNTSLQESFEMRDLNEISWIIPEPDYLHAYSDLLATFKLFEPEKPRKHTIFISYRRADSAETASRLYDRLIQRYGEKNVFKDVNVIPPGVDFVEYFSEALANARIVLVVIGSQWSKIKDDENRVRLLQPTDAVRLEVEAALKNHDILVIPVLASGASFPKIEELPESIHELARRNAINIRVDPDFHKDVDRLIAAIDTIAPI